MTEKTFVVAVQSLSWVWLFATRWAEAYKAPLSSTLSLRVLLKFMFIESVMLSNHFILCCSPLLWPSIFPSLRVFSNELALCITLPKYWSFSFSISPSNEYSGLISFRIDWFDLLTVQGTLKSLLQHQFEITNSSVLSPLYGPTLTPVHDYWKNYSFDYMKFCRQSDVSAFCMTLKTKNPLLYIFFPWNKIFGGSWL